MRRTIIGPQSFAGRGALSNPHGRFESRELAPIDDGWYSEEVPESLHTTLEPERAKAVISRNDSPDVGFEQSINPYRGCSHGCIYCYARPTHAYLGLSPGLDFESRLFYKADAAKLLEQELARPGYVCKSITLGANTDPYQPVERRMQVTRSILEVLVRTRHPTFILSKSALVLRDMDLLAELARDGLIGVGISVTTLDNDLKRAMEPQTSSPQARLRTLAALSAAGIPTTVMAAPMIPALNDHELEAILEAAAAAGARRAGYVLLRLPHEIKDLFREWLASHYPDRAAHVMSLVHDMRGGRDYDSAFGTRMRGTGPFAELLRKRFQLACRRLGLNREPRVPPNTRLFRPPAAAVAQLHLGL
ncbi:MAG TPA: PA0069 family radical SAM protein [Steroidobacteraceae bacterium]|nr:PA0069 family radical SAM protein [Steroidobacteraceae bacterium]